MERMFVDVFDELPFGVAVFDSGGACSMANAGFELLVTDGGCVGRGAGDLLASCFSGEHAAAVLEDLERVSAGAETAPYRVCRAADGRFHACSWRPASTDRGGAVLTVTDVTATTERLRALEHRVALSAALAEVETALLYTSDFEETLAALVSDVPRVAQGCTAAAALVRAPGGWEVRHVHDLSRALLGRIFPADAVPGATQALDSRRPAVGEAVLNESLWGSGHVLAIPLAANGEIAAMLVLFAREVPPPELAMEFADKLATVASFALENTRLQAAERETREALETALLGVVRGVPGITFGHLYRSATRHAQVGGDFYELFGIDEKRVGILMGDVSGKGVTAASLAALVKTSVKLHASDSGSPARVMARTNEILVRECDSASFVTAFYAVLNVGTGDISYCCAGHPPALLWRGGRRTIALGGGSPLLGAYPDMRYEDHATHMDNGDVMLLYTDGVTEARRGTDQYGTERLLALMSSIPAVDPRELPELVFEDVFAHVQGELSDDMAILAVSPTLVGHDAEQQRLDV